MPRKPRWMQLAHDAAYRVMCRGHNREPLFADPDDRAHFFALLARYRDRFGFRLYHYGVMTNHVHLLLQLDDARRLSSLMAGAAVGLHASCQPPARLRWTPLARSVQITAVQREGYWLSCARTIEQQPRNVSRLECSDRAGCSEVPLPYGKCV
jgi:putative transposase